MASSAVIVGSGCCASAIGLLLLGRRSTVFLARDEQLRVQKRTEMEVHNGPGLKLVLAGSYRSKETVKAETLSSLDYVLVRDALAGAERVEVGPKLLFLGSYETVERRGKGITLGTLEYVLVENKVSGAKSVMRGPCVWFPTAQEEGVKHSAISLSSTEYVQVVDRETGKRRIEKGPCVWFPGPMEDKVKGQGISLSSTEYVLVENKLTGRTRIEKGPLMWFPGPLEEGQAKQAITLSATQYITVEDQATGNLTMVKGPCVWFPQPDESASEVKEAIALQDDEYVRLKDMASGRRWVAKGKALVFLEPTWRGDGVRKAWVLKKYEIIRLFNTVTGRITTHRGEATIFPEANEAALDGDKMAAIDLKVDEYVKLLDMSSGEIRVVAGQEQVFLGPHERVLDGGKRKAEAVDSEHAVLVRNKDSGQLRLVTEQQLFVPGPDDTIEAVRPLITLSEHEAIIVKDKDGNFRYHFGSPEKQQPGQQASFFLPPHAEIVKLCWSRGRRRDKRDLYIERFDCRAQYMSFEFNCRTKDNVELVLEGTFFWEVVDLPRMVQTTGDTSGDICNHARSQFIRHVARVSLQEFMDDLNVISNKVYQEDQSFYESRGVKVHSLEVTSYKCAEESTSKVLQQIIQETTNRMNRLSQQESENEVKIFGMQGQIEQEKLNGQLLSIQHEHAKMEASVAGAAEADRITAFLSGLHGQVPELTDRIALWKELQKNEALSAIAKGSGSIHYTPNDTHLSIEAKAL